MRFPPPPTLLTLLFTLLSTTHSSYARPKISDEFRELLESRYHYLAKRNCANPCGWAAPGSPPPLCCGSDQTCSTNSFGQAVCNSGSGSGVQAAAAQGQGQGQSAWEFYTTTIIESGLITRTTTYSRSFGAEQAAATPVQTSGLSCQLAMGEKPCGTICCATGQYCAVAGQCAASNVDGDGSSSILGSIFMPAPTNTAPLRPTSNAATTVTSTGSATTTVPFSTPSSAAASPTAAGGAAGVSASGNNGLSGGAIAGIVIGVLLGILLLFLLILYCCAATAGNAVRAFFGLGKKRRRREDVTLIEEHRHHQGAGAAGGGRRWFGTGPARVDRPPKKKSGGLGGLTAVAGGDFL